MASSVISQPLRSFVRGRHVTQASPSRTLDLFHAATGKPRASLEVASSETIHEALEAAREAQSNWNIGFSPLERAHILRRAAQRLREEEESIATLETMDTGRPIFETRCEAPGAADALDWFAGLAPSIGGQHLPFGNHSFGYTRREPLGLTVGIGAWNYPLQSAAWKSAPALAFGNSMVFKPSEFTPSTALRLAEIYQEAGVPDGIFNVVLGDGPVGRALVEDPRPRKVSFTGSVETGRKIYTRAAEDFKKVTLELGGKSPLIIFDDADLESAVTAVTAAMMANWYSSGQVCSNGTRVFVHSQLMNTFLERLVERTQRLRLGDPMSDDTNIGPMISEQHMNKVLSYIQMGVKDDGATLLYGGKRIEREGFFLEPAIFVDCTDTMRIVQEEIFGMVMAVLPFDDEEEVLERANATSFGLSAGVFTNNLQRGHRVVANLEAGTTWINNYNLAPVELPWGGFKSSGVGSENGVAGVESWTKMKSVYVEMKSAESPYD